MKILEIGQFINFYDEAHFDAENIKGWIFDSNGNLHNCEYTYRVIRAYDWYFWAYCGHDDTNAYKFNISMVKKINEAKIEEYFAAEKKQKKRNRA